MLASAGVLHERWADSKGASLWDATWHKAKSISPNLSPEMLRR